MSNYAIDVLRDHKSNLEDEIVNFVHISEWIEQIRQAIMDLEEKEAQRQMAREGE